jgi:phosphoglucosamine mutase
MSGDGVAPVPRLNRTRTTAGDSMASRNYFGTDGVRGRVGEEPITPEFVLKLGWAAGRVLGASGGDPGKILIGKDTRVSGYLLESALESGLSAAGMDVSLLGPMPTPAVAYLTRTARARAGIVISASHNPYEDNGIKFFSAEGTKLPDEVELEIERTMSEPLRMVPSGELGKAFRYDDAGGRYVEFCKSTFPNRASLEGLRIVLDCANGAAYHVAPLVFGELGADVTAIANEPDGFNINRDCGSTCPDTLRRAVLGAGAHLGIALDGDGDRVVMVDAQGAIVDGDQLLYIIAVDRLAKGAMRGGLVGTLMSNFGLEMVCRARNIPFVRAAVGDRYVMNEMMERGWDLGGETSGHIICLDKLTTGDGIIAALQVLSAMARTGRSLAEMRGGMTLYPQHMVNVRMARRFDPKSSALVQDAVRAAERELRGQGRVVLRPSGTEPVIRVMVEGSDSSLVVRLSQELADVVQRAAETA